MKKIILASVILVISTQAYSHSGRTDQSGGHNCSQKSINKGLCTGYHYHNSGSIVALESKSKHEHNGIKHEHGEAKEVITKNMDAKVAH